MKYLNIVLCVMMVLFIAVQINDPDGMLWALIYAIPTAWAGLAAFRLQHVLGKRALSLLGLSLVCMFVLTAYYWPRTEGFWHKDVWMITETAREGMGMMIALLVTLIAAATIWAAHRTRETGKVPS